VKKYPGFRYCNITWHDVVQYTPNELLKIYDDIASLGMMNKNNKLHFLLADKNL